MKTLKEQDFRELAETLKKVGEDHLEEKAEILQEVFRRRQTLQFRLEPEIGEVFVKAARELTAVLDKFQLF